MGNCVGAVRKKKKSGSRETSVVELNGQPRVNQWLESSDFSSIPDLEHFGEPATVPVEEDLYRPSTSQAPVVQEGYSTAPEDLSEEDEPVNAPDASIADKDSEYLTSDEQEHARRCDTLDRSDDPYWKALMDTLNETIGNDLTPVSVNVEDQPICALPTPLRKNMISPRTIEALADEKGRVKRKKMARYLELRQEAMQPV